jgi:hypothetical protein
MPGCVKPKIIASLSRTISAIVHSFAWMKQRVCQAKFVALNSCSADTDPRLLHWKRGQRSAYSLVVGRGVQVPQDHGGFRVCPIEYCDRRPFNRGLNETMIDLGVLRAEVSAMIETNPSRRDLWTFGMELHGIAQDEMTAAGWTISNPEESDDDNAFK